MSYYFVRMQFKRNEDQVYIYKVPSLIKKENSTEKTSIFNSPIRWDLKHNISIPCRKVSPHSQKSVSWVWLHQAIRIHHCYYSQVHSCGSTT